MASSSRHVPDSQYHSRSRSPVVNKSQSSKRSRSPGHRRHQQEHHRSKHAEDARPSTKSLPRKLPFKAQELGKRDLESHRNLLALYLDVQKQIDVAALDENEVKGRWKSFVRKWNEGDLAEGWYDPSTRRKADEQESEYTHESRYEHADEAYQDDDDIGPVLPRHIVSNSRSGPAIPNSQDLRYRDEIVAAHRSAEQKDVKYERKLERQQQKERLDELVPRAEAGTRERQLEKKQEAAASRAAFRAERSPGAEEVRENDLMGDDGIDAYKRKKLEEEKKKTDRQLRKEEIWRARAEERREKLSVLKEKEDKTMDMLKALAQQRYG